MDNADRIVLDPCASTEGQRSEFIFQSGRWFDDDPSIPGRQLTGKL